MVQGVFAGKKYACLTLSLLYIFSRQYIDPALSNDICIKVNISFEFRNMYTCRDIYVLCI